MTSRRTFIQQAGLLATTALITPSFTFKKKYKLGLQLYSIRGPLARDLKVLLNKLLHLVMRKWRFTDTRIRNIMDSTLC